MGLERYKPVVAAIEIGDVDRLRALIDADADVLREPISTHRRTALHVAAMVGKTDMVQLLLERGANPNTRDRGDHAYPMHFAAELGYLKIVQLLADAGGDVRGGGDTHGLGVLGWATCFGQTRHDVAQFLLERGATHTIFSAAAMGDGDAVRQIVEQDPTSLTRFMSPWENQRTPLHLAVIKNQHAMVELLLELGADPYLPDKNDQTPLQLALTSGDRAMVSLFAARGIELDEYIEQGVPLSGVTPILCVKDVPASIAYFETKLGFHKDWDWGDPVGFASVSRGKVALFLCDGQGQPGSWMSIWVEDVDALYEEFQQRGAIIRQPPTNFSWGCREMNVADPDGNRFRFSSHATGESDGVPLAEG
jgi:ankyrin repeat protein